MDSIKYSVIIPCYRSEFFITNTINEIVEEFGRFQDTYEVILVNDCSPDKTIDVLKGIAREYNQIKVVDLAKNFGQHSAIMAGLHICRGEYLICMDDDGQTAASEVVKLIEKIKVGYDVVYAKYSNKQHSKFKNFGSKVNSFMAEKAIGKPKDIYLSSFFIMKRFVADEIKKYDNIYSYLPGLVLRSTKSIANADVVHKKREIGESNYSIRKLVTLWVNGLTSFSISPLRIAIYVGFFEAVVGLVYALIVIVQKIVDTNVSVGWTSLIATILIVGGTTQIMIGFVGEYIGRIYMSINKSPQFVIREVIDFDE